MFACNRYETKQIMSGLASGCTRVYESCPHAPGSDVVLTSKYLDGSGRSIPFAKATVTAVRPGTVGEFRRSDVIPEMDGYENGEVWVGQMRQMYPSLKDTDRMHHVKFRINEIDKSAGRRGDKEGARDGNS